MLWNMLNDLAEAMKALDGKKLDSWLNWRDLDWSRIPTEVCKQWSATGEQWNPVIGFEPPDRRMFGEVSTCFFLQSEMDGKAAGHL